MSSKSKRRPDNLDGQDLLDWIFTQVRRTETGCWEWTRCLDGCRYGMIGHQGKIWRTSRLVYELMHGIPEGMQVLHRCDNPPCINPDHLWIGTQQDNIVDMYAKGRDRTSPQRGENNPSAKLSEDAVRQILEMAANGVTQATIARHFGVCDASVHGIRTGRTWRHVTGLVARA